MRRYRKRPITMATHPDLFAQAEKFRKLMEKNGVRATSIGATGLMAKYVRVPKNLKLDDGKTFRTKKRKCS